MKTITKKIEIELQKERNNYVSKNKRKRRNFFQRC